MSLSTTSGAHVQFSERLAATVAHAVTPGTRGGDGDAFLSEQFVAAHTEFESLDSFCRAAPTDRDTVESVRRLPASERDAFVADTTEFDSWDGLLRAAATTDLVALLRT